MIEKFPMTSVEQHKIVNELCQYEAHMSRNDLDEFVMYRKRDTDDEDLDIESKQRLMEMFEKYVTVKKAKGNPLNDLFKKTSPGDV